MVKIQKMEADPQNSTKKYAYPTLGVSRCVQNFEEIGLKCFALGRDMTSMPTEKTDTGLLLHNIGQ
jgi:hypothetical protein